MTIERAHTLILKIGADTAKDLADHLRFIASDVERNEITVGTSGGPSCGYTYSYKTDPSMTHDEYFRQINEWLDEQAASRTAARDRA